MSHRPRQSRRNVTPVEPVRPLERAPREFPFTFGTKTPDEQRTPLNRKTRRAIEQQLARERRRGQRAHDRAQVQQPAPTDGRDETVGFRGEAHGHAG